MKKEFSCSLFFIPENSCRIRKIRLSEKQIRCLAGAVITSFFFFVFNVIGFWYYRSLHASFEQDRQAIAVYEEEKSELVNKVAVLEKSVNETEKLAVKLASLVGPERIPMQKGVGPIPNLKEMKFDKALEPKLENLEDRSVTLQAKIKELSRIQEDKLMYIASTPSIWPVKGWVTSDFGYRRSPFTLANDFHSGLDIAVQWGTPIVAPADGVVTFSGRKGGFGNTVIIDHGFGVSTHYGHTSSLLVQEGMKIKRGEKIALVGNTGHSTGPHLHYEIHVDGVPVDPMKYILQ